jgi:hypothetical protein
METSKTCNMKVVQNNESYNFAFLNHCQILNIFEIWISVNYLFISTFGNSLVKITIQTT